MKRKPKIMICQGAKRCGILGLFCCPAGRAHKFNGNCCLVESNTGFCPACVPVKAKKRKGRK
jgi:hypothetical protein